MTLKYWFSHVLECGIALPDVIADVYRGEPDVPGPFTIVYEQPNTRISTGSPRFPATTAKGGMFIAVHNDLVSTLSPDLVE